MNTGRTPSPLWNPYVAGVALGIVLFAAYFLSGFGLGGSGGIARTVAFCLDQVASEQVDRNAYFAPLAGGATNPLNHRMVWMMVGVLAGGFVSGWLAGRAGVETIKGPAVSTRTRWILAIVGGMFMGYGAGLGRGCTSGQALSGGAVLAVGSWAFMMMVFAGAYLLAYPLRRLWN
jgi:uncharacterized membrane protein YedE/YeeE